MRGFANSLSLVTGGAHRVGKAIAISLAENGSNVVVHYHQSETEAKETQKEIEALGVSCWLYQADLRTHQGVVSLFSFLDQQGLKLDNLINSAAVMERMGLLDVTESDFHRTIDLNLKGAFFCLQQAGLRMKQGGGGVIINISDIAGLQPWEHFSVHSISKAGLNMLTQVAALALAPEVRVNAIAPGPVLKPRSMSMERWDEIGQATALGSIGDTNDVVDAVHFLLGNEYITGVILPVDGGAALS